MRRRWLAATLAVGLLTLPGCLATLVDPMGRQNSLEEAQRRYTALVRWGEIERAAQWVVEDEQETFLSLAPSFERIRMTDAAHGPLVFEDGDSATVTVTYRAYSLDTLVEKTFVERQEWSRAPGMGNEWRVRSQIDGIFAAVMPGTQ